MFNNWAAHFNISTNETQRPAAMQRFCKKHGTRSCHQRGPLNNLLVSVGAIR